MNVFISWSGSLSKAFGELLVTWLPDVIQRVKPWLSSQNIDKGSLWPREINEALSTTVGILCVTQKNKDAPWMLFEAGALQKGLTEARVCPLLIDLAKTDLEPPLSLFNLTSLDKEDMWQLVISIDKADPENRLPEERLKKSFAQRWSDFEEQSKKIRGKHKTAAKKPERDEREMIIEVLEITRAIQRALARSESKEPIVLSAPLSGISSNIGTPLTLQSKYFEPKEPWQSPGELLNTLIELGKAEGAKKSESKGSKLYMEQLERLAKKSENKSDTGSKS